MKACKSARRLLCVWLPDGPPGSPQDGASQPEKPAALAAAALVTDRASLEKRASLERRAALERLAVWCERFSPTVALDESEAFDTLLLDITGLAHLFGGEPALARHVVDEFKKRGLAAQVAVADTIGAAWALSHFGLGIADCGLCCVFPSSNPQSAIRNPQLNDPQLEALPIAALRVPQQTARLLSELGIHTIVQLQALPRDQLSARFGPELLLRLDQATGACDEALVAYRKPPEAFAEQLLEYPLWRRDGIRQVLQGLIRQVCQEVAERGEGILQLNCCLDVQAGAAVNIPVGLYQPSTQDDHLLGLVDLQFERLRLREPVIALQVTATATDRMEVRQSEIADCGFRIADCEQQRGLAQLVDRLSSRLGREAVLAPRLLADAVPEIACRLEPMTSARLRKVKRKRARKSSPTSRKTKSGNKKFSGNPARSDRPPARPLWLEPQPIALTVTAILPDGPPIRFCWAGNSYDVAEWWGPERIETSWWRKHEPRRVRRDYYQVETTSGQRFWLFRRRDDNRWFLHGEFG